MLESWKRSYSIGIFVLYMTLVLTPCLQSLPFSHARAHMKVLITVGEIEKLVL